MTEDLHHFESPSFQRGRLPKEENTDGKRLKGATPEEKGGLNLREEVLHRHFE